MKKLAFYERIKEQESNFSIRLLPMTANAVCMPHWHEATEILYFTKGDGIVRSGNNNYAVLTGDLAIANGNEIHARYPGNNTDANDVVYYCLTVYPSFFSDIGLEDITLQRLIRNDGFVNECFRKMINENEQKNFGYKLALKAYVCELMLYLVRNYRSEEKMQNNITVPDNFSKVIDYIFFHYSENFSTAELAKMCYVTESYFCRNFKKITGCTAVDYINCIRVERATYFLEKTDDKITEIALKTGFSDVNYFSRIFKRLNGRTPTECRKILKKQLE